ncbi:PEP-utilizing enzyme [Halobacillus litoralis]|uniref:PEP-utilizing enzyme n=1 Tax=Halobacillus litoralis TaxID=45668 RepID=UPI00299E1EF0|nr:PEP-utilizing enzyme [Halobacillus litoralis]
MSTAPYIDVFTNLKNEIFMSDEDKKNYFWEQDGVHFAKPITPLYASFMVPGLTNGTKEAFEKLKLPTKQFVAKVEDGFFYQRVPMHENIEERLAEHQQAMMDVFPNAMKVLDDYVQGTLLPYYKKLDQQAAKKLSTKEAEEAVLELYDMYSRIWSIHFEVVMPRMSMGQALEQVYGQALNTENVTEVYELLLGQMNKSLETDRELWKLSLKVKDSKTLSDVFEQGAEELLPRLEQTQEGRDFLSAIDDFLSVYGHRTANSHEFADETWIENPFHALKIVKNYVEKEFDFEAEFQQVIEKRQQKVEEVLAEMPEGELKETFKGLHAMALDMWGLDEDHHFYIDAMLPAKSRPLMLNIGETLLENSVIQDREDIMYIYLDELIEFLRKPKKAYDLIQNRKAEHQENLAKTPAPIFGTPPEGPVDPVVERVFGTKQAQYNEETQSFSGYAGSQGTHMGRVKIVTGQDEFEKVNEGDVLVCKTTTPPWTVLFNIAGAIVTDRGGVLSHAATVAREYEVPCVVGAKMATSELKDGDLVTVDGTNGDVIIHERS